MQYESVKEFTEKPSSDPLRQISIDCGRHLAAFHADLIRDAIRHAETLTEPRIHGTYCLDSDQPKGVHPMYEYKFLIASQPQEMERYINQWAATEGWRVRGAVRPPTQPKGPQSKWYATLERKLMRLTWTKNNETDLAGYKLYWSKTPPNGVQRVWTVLAMVKKDVMFYDVPMAIYAQPGIEYVFSVSAFDIAGNESKQTIIATIQR